MMNIEVAEEIKQRMLLLGHYYMEGQLLLSLQFV